MGPLSAPHIDLRQSLDTRSRPPTVYFFRISKATVEEGEQDEGAGMLTTTILVTVIPVCVDVATGARFTHG